MIQWFNLDIVQHAVVIVDIGYQIGLDEDLPTHIVKDIRSVWYKLNETDLQMEVTKLLSLKSFFIWNRYVLRYETKLTPCAYVLFWTL